MDQDDGAPILSEADRRFRILNWIAIVDQLATTKANRVLDAIGLPMPQFVVLNHFSHRPHEPRTVTGVAAAFQQPQPGMTKTIQKLVERGYLRSDADANDGRIKRLLLTAEGLAAHKAARERLAPSIATTFAGWDAYELDTLLRLLDRLRVHLDTHRDPA
jgi:DNA-binding MarR family transcriptional regulator